MASRRRTPPPGTRRSGHAGQDRSAAIKRLVVESIADSLDEKATKHASSKSPRAQLKAEILEHIGSHVRGLDVWTREEPAARRPRFTRDTIAEAAIRIADTEGFEAVSMRRIAAELGAGTMTLYHYVHTKDELLSLVCDAVMAETLVAADEPELSNWRDCVVRIARRSRASLQHHPWLLDITDDPPLGPNAVLHFDQSIGAVSTLPISFRDQLDIVTAVDEYVFGFCLFERNNLHRDDATQPDAAMVEYVNSLIETGEYRHLARLAAEAGVTQLWEQVGQHLRDEGRFERNLHRLLDGVEASFGIARP